jgi:hypothetical protein
MHPALPPPPQTTSIYPAVPTYQIRKLLVSLLIVDEGCTRRSALELDSMELVTGPDMENETVRESVDCRRQICTEIWVS